MKKRTKIVIYYVDGNKLRKKKFKSESDKDMFIKQNNIRQYYEGEICNLRV